MQIVRKGQVPKVRFSTEFAGETYGVDVSFLIVEAQPGEGPSTHSHDYPEIIIVQQGQVTCVVGDEECTAYAGDVLFIAANEPHRFFNSGREPLVQIDIHLRNGFETQWHDAPMSRLAEHHSAD